MAIVAGQLHSQTDGTTAIDTLLTQEANRIGPDIHKRTMHISPWLDLIKQSAFPDGMGSTLGTLIYDRALPTTLANGSVLGVNWTAIGTDAAASKLTASSLSQILVDATDTNIGPNVVAGKAFIQFSRQFKQYSLKRAVIESPRINVEDLRYAAFRTEQLRAIMDAMTESTRWTLEERYRDEYDRLCENIVICKTSATAVTAKGTVAAPINTFGAGGFFDADVDVSADDGTADPANAKVPNATISNKVMDSLYFRLVRGGAGMNAYGRENARPVFACVMSSEASYSLMTETGFRDDYRYNASKVGDLIAPLGVERSHRGFYHLIDDMAPRFTFTNGAHGIAGYANANDCYLRVYPFSASSGIISNNASYETAEVELAYLLHQEVMESQVPSPNVSGPGVSFNPVDYKGKFNWLNIQDENLNPDKTIGFFRGVIATASKPIKTEFGYVLAFLRTGDRAA